MNKQVLGYLRLSLLWALVFPAFPQIVLHQDYKLLPMITPYQQKKPFIVEFFSFACPACFEVEKTLAPWLRTHQDKIQFFRIPVVYHKSWELYAKAYYAAATLQLLPQAVPILFQAIQKNKISLATSMDYIDFFVKTFHLAPPVVTQVFHDPALDQAVQDGMAKAIKLGITRIPAFTVNGRYMTDLYLLKNPQRLPEVLDKLSQLDLR